LHGLAEWGRARWRAKDWLDLWLLTGTHRHAPEVLAEAIRVAFESRHYAAADARRTLEDPFWDTFAARARWNRFLEEQGGVPVPESISAVRADVAARLSPALDLLPR
jgi:hypothetical protein